MATGEKGPATDLDSAPAVCCGVSATRAIAPAIPHLPSHYAPVILELVKPLYSESSHSHTHSHVRRWQTPQHSWGVCWPET